MVQGDVGAQVIIVPDLADHFVAALTQASVIICTENLSRAGYLKVVTFKVACVDYEKVIYGFSYVGW